MDFEFKEMSLEQIKNIIDESDMSRLFLPLKDEPDLKVSDLFDCFRNIEDFHIFSFIYGIELTGYISLLPMSEENALSIGPMFIRQKYQGLGLGKKQVIKVMEWAKNNKIMKLYTKTWGQNSKSRRIFESLEFKVIAEIPSQRINGDSTVKYEYVVLKS